MKTSDALKVGQIVRCRDRSWVVLPSSNRELVFLRPLSGNEPEICAIAPSLGLETITPDSFPLPDPQSVQDQVAIRLLMYAIRLNLRNGASPLRCLGNLSVRPRPYQLVPMLMALRQEVVRLLIADDVGIGKTIEACLIARELLDRKEINRIAVLCPPHLCDQWQRELQEKFNIEAVVIRSGTASRLERSLPNQDQHIFSYYQHLVVSIDYAKAQSRCDSFVTFCPDLVIVDEVHTCAGNSQHQQQRNELLKRLASRDRQHLIFLSATPHSGKDENFLSILSLLRAEFGNYDLEQLTKPQRIELAKHFVQRRRADVKQWLGDETPFPQRESKEIPYRLSPPYRQLFDQVFEFARQLVQGVNDSMSYAQQRGCYWSALALIRCVMSSPAAAIASLSKQGTDPINENLENSDPDLPANYIYDRTDQETNQEQVADNVPFPQVRHRRYREFCQQAQAITSEQDAKLTKTIETVRSLLNDNYHPIIWCRYIATAQYVAQKLDQTFSRNQEVMVRAITGEQPEEHRIQELQQLARSPKRILVATDCLSEGVNLQEHFSAVIHYDLPWNPNRLEQREGRIDRFGQTAPIVKTYLLYGQDNPVDGAVLEVLIRKAIKIHRSLGVTVPIPMDSDTVAAAIFNSLFNNANQVTQLSLFSDPWLAEMDKLWERSLNRETVSRTRFAQSSICPEDVQTEMEESDRILGSPHEVEQFVKSACNRMGYPLTQKQIDRHPCWRFSTIPPLVQDCLDNPTITFSSPHPPQVQYIGRNHPLVSTIAQHLITTSLTDTNAIASRCGYTITNAVSKRTTVLIMRLRHHLQTRSGTSDMAEECLTLGFTGSPAQPQWLTTETVLDLIHNAEPIADHPPELKRMELQEVIDLLPELDEHLDRIAQERSQHLSEVHRRIRQLTQAGHIAITPHLPMDTVAIHIFKPL